MKIKKFESFKDQMKKILIFYSLIPIIITAILGYGVVYYLNFRSVIKKNNIKLEEISKKIDSILIFSDKKIKNISENEIVREAILNKNRNKKLFEVLYENNIKKRVDGYIFLYDKNLQILANTGEKIEDESWGIFYRMKQTPNEVERYIGNTYFNNREISNFCIGKVIQYKNDIVGYVVYYFLEDGVKKAIGDLNGVGVIISDKYGNIIFSSISKFRNSIGRLDKRVMDKNGYFKYENKRFYIKSKEKNGIVIYTISYIDYLVSTFKESLCYLTIVFIILLFLMSKIAQKLAIEKTKTLSELIKAIKKIESGNLNTKVNIKSRDEFEIIGMAYNEMLENIKILLERNKEETKHSIISEIRQLESQFNPHFLFNSLEMLRYSIQLDKSKAIKIILNMASILRYSIENNSSEVQLEKEIFYIKNYLELQKLRLGENFTYFLKYEKELEKLILPKLILQPLVENSIKYGYTQDKGFYVFIKIKKRDKNLQIDIYDNGNGIEREKLKKIRERLNKNFFEKGLGLYSIQRRINLLYGKGYGIKIFSNKRGSYIKILIPLKEGKVDDKGFDS